MRVSSNAPAMSRRSILRGMAAALVGASVPVAAIAGITARKLMNGNDTELLGQCRQWEDGKRRLKRLEKEMNRLYRDAQANMPPKPPELFEPIEVSPNLPLYDPSKRIDMPDGSWAREPLMSWIERPFNSRLTPIVGPTPECRTLCRKLLALLDQHEKTQEGLLAPYRRLDAIWERENTKNTRLFNRIIRIRAMTLKGAAGQLRIIELDGALSGYHSEVVGEQILGVARNIRRLVAAQATVA